MEDIQKRSVVDLWEDSRHFNGLRSPEVEEEKTKESLERKGVAVRDLEHLEYWSPSNLKTGGELSSTRQEGDISPTSCVPMIQVLGKVAS
ncbi:hypothetical protein CsSME_00016161 [Camellia sinensis var. sinensis]